MAKQQRKNWTGEKIVEHKIAFPHMYKALSKNEKQYKMYIQGFLERYHPNMELVRIEKHYVICKKK